jgi:S1-C subfamily serine protease
VRAAVISIVLGCVAPAFGGESLDSAALRSIHSKLGPSTVRIETVVRKQLDNGVDVDLTSQQIGLIVKPGLVMTTADAFQDVATLGSNVAELRVVVAGGAEFEGSLSGVAAADNLAFVAIDDPAFSGTPVEFASADELAVGDFFATVRLAGPSFRSAPYVDAFLVSATLDEPRCYVTTYAISDYLGAAVVAFDGRVVGIVNRMGLLARAPRVDPVTGQRELELLADVQGFDSDGDEIVIVPASRIAPVLAAPPARDSVAPRERPWLGIETQVMLPALAAALGVEEGRRGVLLTRVLPGSPAATAGLESGDLVYAIDGVALAAERDGDEAELGRRIGGKKPGDAVALEIEREGRELAATLVLGAAPPTVHTAAKHECESFSFAARDLVYGDRAELDLPLDAAGARATLVKRTGFAGLAGLKVGDIVRQIDGDEVRDAGDLATRLEELAAAQAANITLFVTRGADTLFVEMRPDWAAARR